MLTQLANGSLVVETGGSLWSPHLQLVECKGAGHPDTLADDLAEALSRAYACYTLDQCSAVLHHNFDKLCLLGGQSDVSFGHGRITRPVRVLVNGRATRKFAGRSLDVDSLLVSVCKQFFAERLPLLDLATDLEIELNLSTASSPGRVDSDAARADGFRHRWFEPRGLHDLPERQRLLANDTSFGTGYAPKTLAERLTRDFAGYLSARPRSDSPPWLGSDVKVMTCQVDDRVDVVACVPQIADHVPSRTAYLSNLEQLHAASMKWLASKFPELDVRVRFNARDKPETDELYLTAVGSSIESGDEGVVGRGNRANGLITPLRPMNLEGVNGKNPVYHIGKLYNVLAMRIAERFHDMFGGAVAVHLVSATGTELRRPWRAVVQMESSDVRIEDIASELEAMYASLPGITTDILAGRVSLS